MSEISIQIRRVTERVKQYYNIFGLRAYTNMVPGRSVIKGAKRLGFDEVECVVAETSRGTSVGFYAINQLQGLIHTIPIFFVLLISGLSTVGNIGGFLRGTAETSLNFDVVQLFIGEGMFSFQFVIISLLVAGLIFLSEYLSQTIRLDNLKSRFSFYSRDAIWETREVPLSVVAIMAFRSVFMHIWILAILYFGIFAAQETVVDELGIIYNTNEEELILATIDAFSIVGGLVIGLLASHKAITLRQELSRNDERLRISGSITERRYDPILFGLQSALITSIITSLFLSATFFNSGGISHIAQFLGFAVIGSVVAGLIYEEGFLWLMSAYAVFIFFTSLVLIFRTGEQPAYAYIVVLQLFFVPIPFIMMITQFFDDFLKKYDIRTNHWLYDIFPLTSLITIYSHLKNKETARRSYEKALEDEISEDQLAGKITISKDLLQNPDSNAYLIARHYFELLFTYTASFDETQFIILPTMSQLNQWWTSKTDKKVSKNEHEFLTTSDQLLWDPSFAPDDESLSGIEKTGKEMVLAIQ